MFRLSSIKLWNDTGMPNHFAGKWFLWAMLAISNIIVVVFHFYPVLIVPITGTVAVFLCYILFLVMAYVWNKKSGI